MRKSSSGRSTGELHSREMDQKLLCRLWQERAQSKCCSVGCIAVWACNNFDVAWYYIYLDCHKVTETVCHLSLLSMSPHALPGEEICHKSLLLILIGNVAMERKGIWMSRMICVTCTPFCGYVPAASEKMSRGKTVAVVVVLMGWFRLKKL